MEENEKILHKLPSQEIDYVKILKILLSRWYWIVGSVSIGLVIANVYLWYTPKTYATMSTMKFEEKRSELPGMADLSTSSDRANTSRIQSEISVLQSPPLLLNAVRELDYRISYYVVGRVLNRTNELYPNKPIDVQMIRFDSLNFFHGIVTFSPLNKKKFSISYMNGGKDVHLNCNYEVPFTIGPTAFSIRYPGVLAPGVSFLFKVNAPEDFLGRVAGGFHAAETARNSNIIALQETTQTPNSLQTFLMRS
jgi:tyrosine-protein kinase Etk/Wzc